MKTSKYQQDFIVLYFLHVYFELATVRIWHYFKRHLEGRRLLEGCAYFVWVSKGAALIRGQRLFTIMRLLKEIRQSFAL